MTAPVDPIALDPSPYPASLGIRTFDLGHGRARAVVDLDTLPGNRFGAAHGGLLATLLDVTLAASVRLAAPRCRLLGTVNLDLHFLIPGRGTLTAEAVALRVGSAIGVAQGAVRDGEGNTVAVATGSFRVQHGADAHETR